MSASEDLSKYEAPPNTFWLCTACGKYGPNRAKIGDESCFLNAALLGGTKPHMVGRLAINPVVKFSETQIKEEETDDERE